MIKDDKFPVRPLNDAFNGALNVYNKLKRRIHAVDERVKPFPWPDYENIRFYPYKRVALQLHVYCGCLALVIPGSDKEFPKCDLSALDVEKLSSYKGSNKSWLDATKKAYWPPKRAKGFIVPAGQLQNSEVWGQIDDLLKFAKENGDEWD